MLALGIVLVGSVGSPNAFAVSLGELQTTPKLTPKKFANYFERFSYEFGSTVQLPTRFLARRKGDCDDYAVLASHVLEPRGYETRLVGVRLANKMSHVVCYISDSKAYLDYNNRSVYFNLSKSAPSLRAIADKVAKSLDLHWTSASEYVRSYELDHGFISATVVRTADPANDPPPVKAPAPRRAFLVE